MIDHDYVVRIATLVVARLRVMANQRSEVAQRSESAKKTDAAVLEEKIISARVIEKHPAGTVIRVRACAVITPLAKDTAKDRGIEIMKAN